VAAYCDIAAVQGLLPQRRFAPDTEPSVDQVLMFCTNASGQLDALAADKGVSVPVDPTASPVAYSWLRTAAAYGAAMMSEAAAAAGRQGTGENPRLEWLERMWSMVQEQLMTGQVGLSDATRLSTAGSGAPRARSRASAWFSAGQTWTEQGGL
jgi:hypothetical protein